MNQELGKKPFEDFSERSGERKMNTWKPEPDSKKTKFTPKEILINIGLVFGAILGTLIMIAVLAGIVVATVIGLKTFIRIIQS